MLIDSLIGLHGKERKLGCNFDTWIGNGYGLDSVGGKALYTVLYIFICSRPIIY